MKTLEQVAFKAGVEATVEDLNADVNDPAYFGRECDAAEALVMALNDFVAAKSFTSVAAWARCLNRRAEVLS